MCAVLSITNICREWNILESKTIPRKGELNTALMFLIYQFHCVLIMCLVKRMAIFFVQNNSKWSTVFVSKKLEIVKFQTNYSWALSRTQNRHYMHNFKKHIKYLQRLLVSVAVFQAGVVDTEWTWVLECSQLNVWVSAFHRRLESCCEVSHCASELFSTPKIPLPGQEIEILCSIGMLMVIWGLWGDKGKRKLSVDPTQTGGCGFKSSEERPGWGPGSWPVTSVSHLT